MAIDAALMARARAELEKTRAENARETEERTRRLYARCPRLREIDLELRRLFTGVVSAALHEKADPQSALAEIDARSMALRAEKAETLVSLGFPMDYLDDIFSCKKCRDTGILPTGRTCSCLMALYKAEQAKDLSFLMKSGSGSFEDFDLDYYSKEPDPVYGVSPREAMELVYFTCRRYAENFGPESKNLLLRGSTGLGKTFLSGCVAKTVAAGGHSVVYDTATSAFEAFEMQKFSRDDDRAAEAGERVRRMLGCELFILDDLGTEMTTSFTQSALYTIVNTRLSEGRKTIISTNLSQQELSSRYSAQIVSRIEGEYDTLLFLGSDVRAIKKQRRYS